MSEKQAETIVLQSKQAEALGPAHAPPPVYTQQPGAVYVSQQGPPGAGAGGLPPKDYLVMSILTIFCCFWPLGIVALIKSMEVRNAIARGDYASAGVASRSALQFNKIAIVVGIISLVFTMVLVVLIQLQWIIPLASGRSRIPGRFSN